MPTNSYFLAAEKFVLVLPDVELLFFCVIVFGTWKDLEGLGSTVLYVQCSMCRKYQLRLSLVPKLVSGTSVFTSSRLHLVFHGFPVETVDSPTDQTNGKTKIISLSTVFDSFHLRSADRANESVQIFYWLLWLATIASSRNHHGRTVVG